MIFGELFRRQHLISLQALQSLLKKAAHLVLEFSKFLQTCFGEINFLLGYVHQQGTEIPFHHITDVLDFITYIYQLGM